MRFIKALFENEAVVAVGLITAIVNVAVAFGFEITAEQLAAVNGVLVAVGSLIARSLVWSQSSVEDLRAESG